MVCEIYPGSTETIGCFANPARTSSNLARSEENFLMLKLSHYRLKIVVIRMMALSVFALPGAASDVTMSAELSSKTLSVRWTNSGDHSCLLNLGSVLGKYPLYNLRLTVSSGKENGEASIISDLGAISGRVDPWVVFMPKASQFESNIGLDDIRLNRSGIRVSQVHPPYRLTIIYASGLAYDYAPGGKKIPFSLTQNGPTTVPFCTGSVTTSAEER